jgi:hypothetical protein
MGYQMDIKLPNQMNVMSLLAGTFKSPLLETQISEEVSMWLSGVDLVV